jgi:hypothetical protein
MSFVSDKPTKRENSFFGQSELRHTKLKEARSRYSKSCRAGAVSSAQTSVYDLFVGVAEVL